jgi:hypothetical protein
MLEEIIIDADLCIKLGCSDKYHLLLEVLPLIAKNIYMHSHTYGEVMSPASAQRQLERLITQGTVIVVNETELEPRDRAVYDMAYRKLADVMIDPARPKKNMGEACSLAYAKVKSIPLFATDECDLQPIVDIILNTGIDDIHCLRIVDIVSMARNNEIDLPRKIAKLLWVISGKNRNDFDIDVWPIG